MKFFLNFSKKNSHFKKKFATEYVYIHDVPEVVFPVFPPPDTVTFNPETETVSMPLWYWQEIAEYKIDIDTVKGVIDRIRQIDKAE